MEREDRRIREAFRLEGNRQSPCLDGELLEAFYADRLREGEADTVREHLSICAACLELSVDFRTFAEVQDEDPPNDKPVLIENVVGLFARGLLTRLVTRVYFDDEPSNATDTILTRLPTDRRSTLIAVRGAEGRYHFDIALQGPCETVFFDV